MSLSVFSQHVRVSCFQVRTSPEVTSRCCLLPLLNSVRHCAHLILNVPTSLLSGSVCLTKLSESEATTYQYDNKMSEPKVLLFAAYLLFQHCSCIYNVLMWLNIIFSLPWHVFSTNIYFYSSFLFLFTVITSIVTSSTIQMKC